MGNKCEISPGLSGKMRNMAMLCAFLVVVIHCRPRFEAGTFAWWVKQFLEEGITRVAVPFFFVASGFFAAVKYGAGEGYKSLVLKRLRTLLLPFVIWTLLFWLFVFAESSLKAGSLNAQMLSMMRRPLFFVRKLGFGPAGFPLLTPLWYVRALLCLTLIFPILRGCVRKFGVAWLAAMFALYGVRLLPLQSPTGDLIRAFAGFGLLPVEGLFYYSLGIWLCDRPWRHDSRRRLHAASLLAGLTIVGIHAACVLRDPYLTLAGRAVYIATYKFFSIPFLLYGAWGLMPDWRLPSWLVSYSFGIYLIHKFVQLLMKEMWCAGDGLLQYAAMAILSFVVSLGIAVAMHRYMPKTAAILFGGR